MSEPRNEVPRLSSGEADDLDPARGVLGVGGALALLLYCVIAGLLIRLFT